MLPMGHIKGLSTRPFIFTALPMLRSKRRDNEKEFGSWDELPDGGRRYWRDVMGRTGGMARYVKVTDKDENTQTFVQEIYDPEGKLIELHEKYPIDKGHKTLQS